jgi:hypothetical protein
MTDDRTPRGAEGASRRIPLWLKLAYTAFLGVLVPYYWHTYTPANFLWFCDVALLVTLAALWLESPFLASMQAVAITLPQLLWVVDFVGRLLTGRHLVSMTEYMFDPKYPLFERGLSSFHGWLPFLLLWLVWRLGYDRRAWLAQIVLCWAVLLVSFAVLSDPTGPAGNVNKLFGPRDDAVQTWMPPGLWLAVLMIAYPLLIYVPTHLVFRKVFPEPRRPSDSQ